jgi:hypothetical protein
MRGASDRSAIYSLPFDYTSDHELCCQFIGGLAIVITDVNELEKATIFMEKGLFFHLPKAAVDQLVKKIINCYWERR